MYVCDDDVLGVCVRALVRVRVCVRLCMFLVPSLLLFIYRTMTFNKSKRVSDDAPR